MNKKQNHMITSDGCKHSGQNPIIKNQSQHQQQHRPMWNSSKSQSLTLSFSFYVSVSEKFHVFPELRLDEEGHKSHFQTLSVKSVHSENDIK